MVFGKSVLSLKNIRETDVLFREYSQRSIGVLIYPKLDILNDSLLDYRVITVLHRDCVRNEGLVTEELMSNELFTFRDKTIEDKMKTLH